MCWLWCFLSTHTHKHTHAHTHTRTRTHPHAHARTRIIVTLLSLHTHIHYGVVLIPPTCVKIFFHSHQPIEMRRVACGLRTYLIDSCHSLHAPTHADHSRRSRDADATLPGVYGLATGLPSSERRRCVDANARPGRRKASGPPTLLSTNIQTHHQHTRTHTDV